MGDLGSGKSSVARYLVSQHGFVELTFAGILKSVARDLFNLTEAQVNGTQEQKNTPVEHVRGHMPIGRAAKDFPPDVHFEVSQARTPREILEHLGTEGLRAIDPQVLVRYVERSIEQHRADTLYRAEQWRQREGKGPRVEGIVVSDVRFRNEFDMIFRQGGLVFETCVLDHNGVIIEGDWGTTGHASDTEWRTLTPHARLCAERGNVSGLHEGVTKALEVCGAGRFPREPGQEKVSPGPSPATAHAYRAVAEEVKEG
jgi:hypothetical protein